MHNEQTKRRRDLESQVSPDRSLARHSGFRNDICLDIGLYELPTTSICAGFIGPGHLLSARAAVCQLIRSVCSDCSSPSAPKREIVTSLGLSVPKSKDQTKSEIRVDQNDRSSIGPGSSTGREQVLSAHTRISSGGIAAFVTVTVRVFRHPISPHVWVQPVAKRRAIALMPMSARRGEFMDPRYRALWSTSENPSRGSDPEGLLSTVADSEPMQSQVCSAAHRRRAVMASLSASPRSVSA